MVSGKAHHLTPATHAVADSSQVELFHATHSVGDLDSYSDALAISGDIDMVDAELAVAADVAAAVAVAEVAAAEDLLIAAT